MAKKPNTKPDKVANTVEKDLDMVIEVNNIDNKPEDVKIYDEKGVKLRFSVENFLELPDDIVKDLSFENARNYFITYGLHRSYEKQKKSGGPRVKVEQPMSWDDQRLKVDAPKGIHVTFQPPEMVEQFERIGYVKKGTRTSIQGQPELIEMHISEKKYREMLRYNERLSRQRLRGNVEGFKSKIERLYREEDVKPIDETEFGGE